MSNVTQLPTPRTIATSKAPLAPWPQVDRYPIVLGAMSLATISSAMRQATSGLRQRFVDILNELLEREPHGQAVLAQRNLTVACSRLEVVPAETEPGSNDEDVAKDLAKMVGEQFDAVDDMPTNLSLLLWANYYGITALENFLIRDGRGWALDRFNFIHSRRLSYTDPGSWDLHLFDQGAWNGTARGQGLRLEDYPAKFTVHAPRVRGDYPTREGYGRILGFWISLKALGVSGAAASVERYARPWAIAYFTTGPEKDKPRIASAEDIATAEQAMGALGGGALSSAVLPDSVRVALERVEGGISQAEFIALCDAQIGEVILGQNQTTQLGPNGSKAALSVLKEGSRELFGYDALALAATLRRDVARPLVRLNKPGFERLTPRICLHVDRPDPARLIELADKGARIGMPVDADALADMIGLPLADRGNEKARRLGPIKLLSPSDLEGGTPKPPEPVPASLAQGGQKPAQAETLPPVEPKPTVEET